MRKILVACSMLEDEINMILRREGCSYPVHWMERGLHSLPDRLRAELQTVIDELEGDYDTIILGYCMCGTSLDGIRSNKATLVAMNCYDCIRMLTQEIGMNNHSMYFTAGWIRSDGFIGKEFDAFAAKRGKERAERIYAKMLHGYSDLVMLETGAYDLSKWKSTALEACENLKLKYTERPASLQVLEDLLIGNWDAEHILVVNPGEVIHVT